MASLLAEDLVTVALDPRSGRLLTGNPRAFPYTLAGAVVADLLFRGAAALEDDKVMVNATTGDWSLDAELATIRACRRPRSLDHWVSVLGRGRRLRDVLLNRLVARGAVTVSRHRRLRLFTVSRYSVVDVAARSLLIDQLRAALLADVAPAPTATVMVGLLRVAGLIDLVLVPVTTAQRSFAHSRAKQIVKTDPIGRAVARVVARGEADGAAAAIAAT